MLRAIAFALVPLVAPLVFWYFCRRLKFYFAKATISAPGSVTIKKDLGRNVFETTVRVNGKELLALIDTGASSVLLGIKEAQDVGIDVSTLMFIEDAGTAAGVARNSLAETTVDTFQIGDIVAEKLTIKVNKLVDEGCLVGMTFLSAIDSFEVRDDTITLKHQGKLRTDGA